MRAVDGVVFVVTAGGDLKVESEKIWAEMNRLGLPRIAFVSRLDRERTSFDARDGGSREDARRATGRADPADR